MVMDSAETDFFTRQAKRLANIATFKEPQQEVISKPVRIPQQPTPQIVKFPHCYPCHYQGDCTECAKPLIAKSPNGPLTPCDGSIFWCQFAQASTTWPTCSHFNLQNYPCTHGGGTCPGSGMKWNKHHFGLTPNTPNTNKKEGLKRLC